MSNKVLRLTTAALMLLVALVAPALLSAQTDPNALSSQSLRGYSHVFIAYTIAWLIVLGWLFSVARRLARVERSLER
jgi:CcmD family protein